MKFKKSLVALALVGVATAAWATVTFNASSGTGFIGRGDVITFCGKACLVTAPSIVYTEQVQYAYDCLAVWDTETGGKNTKTIHHVNLQSRQRTVTSTAQVDVNTRQAPGNSNISGYLLQGFGSVLGSQFTEASAAATCPQGDPSGSDNPPATSSWTLVPGSFTATPLSGVLTFQGATIPF